MLVKGMTAFVDRGCMSYATGHFVPSCLLKCWAASVV